VERNPLNAANAKRRQSVLDPKPAELALDGGAATVELGEALRPAS
jgi:hypothetical protein